LIPTIGVWSNPHPDSFQTNNENGLKTIWKLFFLGFSGTATSQKDFSVSDLTEGKTGV